jgi:phage terminase large subunit
MAYGKFKNSGGNVVIDLGDLNPKQKEFCQARSRYVAYGGARGGGKTHVLRVKAYGGALTYPGIRILIIRREYPELEQNIILPMRKMIPAEIASYNGSMRMMFFVNGSIIKFGHFGNGDELEYQGQEYDWIFMEEATQFTESQFRTLGACLRGATKIPRRMYLTCNPGGVGHMWVKRLFIDREYNDGEKGEDYTFIHATVDDNPQLLSASPEYVQMLDLLPEDIRRAHRYGDWDALAGTFFPEFRRETHVRTFQRIPREWKKYRAFDYGLDMFACLWIAVDYNGRAYVYREVQQPDLIVSKAAQLMHDLTPADEHIEFTIAPPDMWNRQKDSGKSMADLYMENGVGLLKASNNRVQGWAALKELLKPMRNDEDKPGLMVDSSCAGLIRNLPAIQHDDKNPSDCATNPHDITHICDALRYFASMRTLAAERAVAPVEYEDNVLDYDENMTGGDMSDDYMNYGGG